MDIKIDCSGPYLPVISQSCSCHKRDHSSCQEHDIPIGERDTMSLDTIFTPIFSPISTQLHSTFLNQTFLFYAYRCHVPLLIPSCSRTNNKNMIQLVQLVARQLIYWATDILKQSCCGSSSPGSCAGTSSAATEHSHHSKFRTSWTWSMSRSVSTT